MRVLDWLLDARQTRGGHCIAIVLAIVLALSFVNLTPMVGVAVADETQSAQAGDVEELKSVDAGDIVADADDEAEGDAAADAADGKAVEDEAPAADADATNDETDATDAATEVVADTSVDATDDTEEPAIAEMVAQNLKARVAEKDVTAQEATDGVAKIGDQSFDSLQAAIDAAQANDVVVMQANIEVSGKGVQINKKTLTLDLNGYTVKGEGIKSAYGAININTGSVLTVIGNGGSVLSNGVVLYVYGGGNLTVKGGIYKGGTAGCLYAENLQHGNNYITIYDGYFSCDEYNGKCFVLNKKDSDKEGCIFVVHGGSFVNCNPAANDNENPVENQLANDCQVNEMNGIYTVVQKKVAQIGDKTYPSLQAAIDAVYSSDSKTAEVKLLEDTSIENGVNGLKIWESCNVTLDLDGHTIYGAIWNYGALTVTGDGVVSNTRNDNAWPAIENYAVATIENGSFVGKNTAILTSGDANTKLTVVGGSFDGGFAALETNGSTVSIGEGSFISGESHAIYHWGGNLTINGGSFAPQGTGGWGTYALYSESTGKDSIVINGGTFTGALNGHALCTQSPQASFDINGGTFAANENSIIQIWELGSLAVNNGTFNNGALENYGLVSGNAEGLGEFVKGGKFTCQKKFLEPYLPDSREIKKVGDYNHVVVKAEAAVASITDDQGEITYFDTLASATKAANNGQTVVMLQDVAENAAVPAGKVVTLDLNGKTITNGASAITLQNQGTLTIVDSSADQMGKIVSNGADDAIDNYGTLNVEAGTIQGGTAWYGIYAGANSTTNVYGTAKVSGEYWGIAAGSGSETAVINVYGDADVSSRNPAGTNGGISASKATTSVYGNAAVHGACGINTNGSLTVSENAAITAEHANAGTAIGVYGGADVVINGGTIKGGAYGISGNGTSDGTKITVNDGEITGLGAGIYHPQEGTLTIAGGKIVGSVGVQMCAGELVVFDAAEITGNGADESASKTGDGAILDGAAVSLVKRANYGEPTATISGGTLKSEQSEAVKVYGWSNSTNKVEEWNDLAEFITGGAFSSDVSGYCAEGYGTAKPADLYTVHQHQIATTIDRAATCTTAGQQTTGCTVDGCLAEKTVEPIAIDPNAHEWGEWTVARPAAPGVEGLEQSVCAHNGAHVQTRTIAALPVTQPNPPAEGSTDGGNEGGNNGAATGNPATPVNPNAGQTPVIPATNPAPADGATIGDDAAPLAANADDEVAEETIDSDETPLAAAGELQAEQGAFNWWPWIIGAAIVLLGLFFFIILARRKKDDDEEEQRA